jgi:hypothetical protein
VSDDRVLAVRADGCEDAQDLLDTDSKALLRQHISGLRRSLDSKRKALECWLFDTKHATYGLSLLRILYGVLVLGLLTVNFADRHYIWGSASQWLQPLVSEDRSPFALFARGSSAAFTAKYLLMGFVAVVFTVGWRTRFVTPVLLILWISLVRQNPVSTDAGDDIVRLMLFYLCFADLSAHWSLDARRRAREAADTVRAGARVRSSWFGNLCHNFAVIAAACQIFVIYLASGMYKVQGEMWQHGTAVAYPIRVGSYMPWPSLSDLLSSNAYGVFAVSYTTVLLQLFFPFLLLMRTTRILALIGVTVMHLGIAVVLALPFFSLAILAADSIFVRDSTFTRLEHAANQLLRTVTRASVPPGPEPAGTVLGAGTEARSGP